MALLCSSVKKGPVANQIDQNKLTMASPWCLSVKKALEATQLATRLNACSVQALLALGMHTKEAGVVSILACMQVTPKH